MIELRPAQASRLAVWLPRLITLAVFASSLGFLLHTSHDPVVLGKYDARYAIFLGLVFFVMLPAFYWLARFCAIEHELKFRSGRTFIVRRWEKIAFFALAWWLWVQAANAVTNRYVVRRLLAYSNDMYHPYLQNTPIPNDATQHINRWGFRGDDLQREKPDDAFRIFMFGGSTVYCGAVPFEQTHCRVLETRLREAYPQYRIEVQNLGGDWHSTEHDGIKLLYLAQDFSPDLVITFHGINDLVRSLGADMFTEGPYFSDYRHYLGAAASLVTQDRKAPLFVNGLGGFWFSDLRFDQMRLNGPDGKGVNGIFTYFVPKTYPVDIKDWKSLPDFERNLREFVAIARSKQMHVLLATQASLYRRDLTPAEQQLLVFPPSHHFHGERASLGSMVDGMRLYNDATRRLAADLDVELVDLEARIPKTTEYLYDDVHYTKAGNELIAEAFARQILESKIIDRVMQSREERTQPAGDAEKKTAGVGGDVGLSGENH